MGSASLGDIAALVLVGGLHIAADPKLYLAGALKLVPPSVHGQGEAVIDTAGDALSLRLKGQLLAMLLVGLLTGFGPWLVGVPAPENRTRLQPPSSAFPSRTLAAHLQFAMLVASFICVKILLRLTHLRGSVLT